MGCSFSCAAGASILKMVQLAGRTLVSWVITVSSGHREHLLRATMAQLYLALTASHSLPLQCAHRMTRSSVGMLSPSAA